METDPKSEQKRKKNRSPGYPGITLQKAIERAREFWRQENKHAAPLSATAAHWGFAPKSSGGLVAIAALKQFGLMVDVGSGTDRKVQLTDAAQRIILDSREESPDRDRLVKTAALRPKIHSELWKKWGAGLPSDQTMATFLILERRYTTEAAQQLIRQFRATISFAKLSASDNVSVVGGDTDADSDEFDPTGAAMSAGVPSELPASEAGRQQQLVRQRAVGEQELARFPLPGGSSVRLLFSGTAGTEQAGDETQAVVDKLIVKFLEVVRDAYDPKSPKKS